MRRLVLIDGNAILYRAFYALPETLTLEDGTPVNAVYGFTSMLLKVIQDLQPSFVVCSFDLPKPTFRDELYADYRAQRPPTPDKLVSQVEMVKSMVKAFGIPICEVEGYEADDVIGTLAKQASQVRGSRFKGEGNTKDSNVAIEQFNNEAIEEVIIVTGDRDLLQLVNSHTKCYMPVKGLTQAKLYGPKEVEEKYGIKPEQMVDYKALVGDPSDNYPGVKGIGPKTAVRLIKQFRTLENIYTSIVKNNTRSLHKFYNSRTKKVLQEYKEDALLAKKLAKIVTDVPKRLDLEKAKLGRLDTLEVKQQFDKLAFKMLWKRVKEIGRSCAADGFRNNDPYKQNTDQNDQLTIL